MSIHGVGISLVNNLARVELLYMCIARYEIIKCGMTIASRTQCLFQKLYINYPAPVLSGKFENQTEIVGDL